MREQLLRAGVPFVEESVFSNGFHGTRFIFETRKDATAAARATGYDPNRFFHRWSITVF